MTTADLILKAVYADPTDLTAYAALSDAYYELGQEEDVAFWNFARSDGLTLRFVRLHHYGGWLWKGYKYVMIAEYMPDPSLDTSKGES